MNDLSKPRATWVEVEEAHGEQRIDNFLLRRLKGVPKSYVYRVLRSGEVRVNSGRVGPDYRLRPGDRVRLPPVRLRAPRAPAAPRPLALPVLYEDAALLAVDKPAGLAVHGGSGVAHGAIERLRASRPRERFLELVHRLDRDTSGVLLVAKRRSVLTALHRLLREGRMEKVYVAAVKGCWEGGERALCAPLQKYVTRTGERRVAVREEGRAAVTLARPLASSDAGSVLELRLLTGRTHQIRVHLAHVGHPVLGDPKYGDFALNRALARSGAARLMLHARRIAFEHPLEGRPVSIEAPLPEDMRRFLEERLALPADRI